jgi:dipeptidyl aminopeptidase/acylaminoacyl peptidase
VPVSQQALSRVHAPRNAKGRPFTADELWKLARVGRPAPSPDDAWLAVPVTTYDMEKNVGVTRLWRVPLDGSEPWPLTSAEGSASEPRFSPDGRRLAFARKKDPKEKPQLHVLSFDGGEPEKLTDLPLGVWDPRWLPDGKRIVFLSGIIPDAGGVEETKKRLEEREKDPVQAHVTEDRVYRFWDRWLTTGEFPHLFVIDLQTKQLTDLTPGSRRWFDFMEPSGHYDIAPDGSEIAFAANATEPPYDLLRTAIFTVPTSGGEVRCLTPDHTADDSRPRYTFDGKSIVYGRQSDPFFYADRVQLVLRDRRTGEEKELAPTWDRSPSDWRPLPDGALVVQAEDRARVKLFRLDPGAQAPVEITSEGSSSSFEIGGNGAIYFLRDALSGPAEVARCGRDGKGFTRVTSFNPELEREIALGEVQELEFEGHGGKPVQGFVVLPPGFDAARKWPLVHMIHGGPHGITGDQFHYRWNPHLLAAQGYVVACVNFHGSTSWGQEFARCIQGSHGDQPFEDVMRLTDALVATGYVDEKRMAATGASYGGYLVSWIEGNTDRFRCIVNHAGVYDILTQYASDVTQGRHKSYGGEPWDGLENVDRWNPARYAKGFVTPMLVIHGERDYRVPVSNGLECYGVLKAKGVAARLVYFPDENHWVLKPRNAILWWREVLDWLERFLK